MTNVVGRLLFCEAYDAQNRSNCHQLPTVIVLHSLLPSSIKGKVQPSFLAPPEWMNSTGAAREGLHAMGWQTFGSAKGSTGLRRGLGHHCSTRPWDCYDSCTILLIVYLSPAFFPHVPFLDCFGDRPSETAMEKWRSSSLWWLPRVRRYSTYFFDQAFDQLITFRECRG